MTRLAGVDGCRGGWLCILKDTETGAVTAEVFGSARELFSQEPAPAVLTIDIPIGLPEEGSRRCDAAAREVLGPRSRSVFPAPIRPALAAVGRTEASRITREVDGRGVSPYAWGIYPKVREVDAALREDAGLQAWVREVHPEVCFWALNSQEPMAHGKKKPEGRRERQELVEAQFGGGRRRTVARPFSRQKRGGRRYSGRVRRTLDGGACACRRGRNFARSPAPRRRGAADGDGLLSPASPFCSKCYT